MSFLKKWLLRLSEKSRDHGKPSPTRRVHFVKPPRVDTSLNRYDLFSKEGYQRNVIVNRSINMVARGVASIPITLHRSGERLVRHKALDLVKKPNPLQKGTGLLYNMTGYYLIAGNSYLLSLGPPEGQPKELWLLRPDLVKVSLYPQSIDPLFSYGQGEQLRHFDRQSVLHWHSFNPLCEWHGFSPLETAATAIDLHNESSRWNLSLIKNGGCPSGVLYQEDAADSLTEGQFSRLKAQVNDHYSGAVNAGRPLLLEGGLKWQDMSISPSDMDWHRGKNMSAREIALAFGVPSQLVGIPDSQTYSNMAEARLSLWEETILPLHQEILNHLNAWLLPRYDEDLEFKADLEAVPALDLKRSRKIDRLNKATFMTLNEKREALGLDPIQEGEHCHD
ncbi:phage portal protein [Temperatibacter marinus]|uniref:Phage portal protein n=1 Tax=Temperatibacter marinus TaxID=1456591 RepID=A0AA52H915_9PROT|nr:phage portal protein [Temperatibacter marinus]WND02047.1 phage portal protein [Temperatibacter marinus]